MPVVEGHLVREVGQVVGALAVNTCSGAEVCGQPVPNLVLIAPAVAPAVALPHAAALAAAPSVVALA